MTKGKLKRVENIKEGKESKEWIETKNACDLSSRTHGLFSGCSLASLLHFLENKSILIYSELQSHGTNMISEVDYKQSVILSLLLCFFKFYSSCEFFLVCGHKLV